MIRLSLSALTLLGLIGYLTVTGQTPWWVAAGFIALQIPGGFNVWIPGYKRKMERQIQDLLKKQEDAYAAQFARDITPPTVH